jgi:signal transduction histidine kinase
VHTSQLYLKEKKYVLAQKYAQEAYDFSRKMGTVYGESEAVKVLYLANKALQNTRKALIYYESYASLRDSFTQANMNSKFAQIQAEYEAERQKDQINQLKLAQKNQEIHEKNLIQYFLVGLLLVLVAFVYWVVINNKKLRKKNQEINQALLKGQTIERKRVASELHDSLGGLLSALKINMYGIHVNDLHPEEQEIYRNLIGMVNEAVQQVRSLSHNLLPDELEEKGLVNSLERLVTKLNYTQKTHFDLRISGLDERLDKNVEFNLYAICLELCNNRYF